MRAILYTVILLCFISILLGKCQTIDKVGQLLWAT